MPTLPPDGKYVRWSPASTGSVLQYWNKETFVYSNASDLEYGSAKTNSLYKSDPNYAALFNDLGDNSIEIIQSDGSAPQSKGDPFGGLLKYSPLKNGNNIWPLLALVAVAGFVAYFLYKFLKK